MPKYIISGGGTGGHIFPAIAIADALSRRVPDSEILFVGAMGRMEMERVPKAGYRIIGLDIQGIQRRLTWKNLLVPLKVIGSLIDSLRIIKDFKPQVCVGVGGYASGPLLHAAAWKGIPTLIQEQNSYPGITNKLLARRAKAICVAYEGMDRFFPAERIHLTGNPVRKEMVSLDGKRDEAFTHFNLDPTKKTLLIVGGSLGARSLNDAMIQNLESFEKSDIQVLWQTGRLYHEKIAERMTSKSSENIFHMKFIDRMDLAYAAANVIVSRAGAISISELCMVGKPTVLVPSPNVSEDHQTKNARALSDKDAAILIKDSEVAASLFIEVQKIMSDDVVERSLSENIKRLSRPDATEEIVQHILDLSVQ